MKEKWSERLFYYVFSLLFLLFSLGPILWCFLLSLTEEYELFHRGGGLLPPSLYLGNYRELLDHSQRAGQILLQGIGNSVFLSLLCTFIGIFAALPASYAFSRYEFRGRIFVLRLLVLTTVIPAFATLIPLYAVFSKLGLLDKRIWAAIVYISSFLPLITWIMMNYFSAIPDELYDAARVDGCTERQLFFRVILPLSGPILLTVSLMLFLMSWGQFQIPLILISSPEKRVLTLVLSDFMGRNDVSYGLICASGILSLLIPALLAVLFRNFLLSGLMQGSVKG